MPGGHLGGCFHQGFQAGLVHVTVPALAALHPSVPDAPSLHQRPTLAQLLPYRSQGSVGVVPVQLEGGPGRAAFVAAAFPGLRTGRHLPIVPELLAVNG